MREQSFMLLWRGPSHVPGYPHYCMKDTIQMHLMLKRGDKGGQAIKGREDDLESP
jgi:hypothetical protein